MMQFSDLSPEARAAFEALCRQAELQSGYNSKGHVLFPRASLIGFVKEIRHQRVEITWPSRTVQKNLEVRWITGTTKGRHWAIQAFRIVGQIYMIRRGCLAVDPAARKPIPHLIPDKYWTNAFLYEAYMARWDKTMHVWQPVPEEEFEEFLVNHVEPVMALHDLTHT